MSHSSHRPERPRDAGQFIPQPALASLHAGSSDTAALRHHRGGVRAPADDQCRPGIRGHLPASARQPLLADVLTAAAPAFTARSTALVLKSWLLGSGGIDMGQAAIFLSVPLPMLQVDARLLAIQMSRIPSSTPPRRARCIHTAHDIAEMERAMARRPPRQHRVALLDCARRAP